MNNDMIKELHLIGLIPVIKIENADDAVPLAKALIDGGLPAAEITFRTKCAAEAIKNITEAFPEMLVGAGTVLTTEQVDAAIAAGSKFLVSPGLNPKVTAYCLSKGVPMLPGCSNPSDVEAALRAGHDIRHGLIGPGVFASHGYERSHVDGVEATFRLIKAYFG